MQEKNSDENRNAENVGSSSECDSAEKIQKKVEKEKNKTEKVSKQEKTVEKLKSNGKKKSWNIPEESMQALKESANRYNVLQDYDDYPTLLSTHKQKSVDRSLKG